LQNLHFGISGLGNGALALVERVGCLFNSSLKMDFLDSGPVQDFSISQHFKIFPG
jgi:hypothetical protein